jgi:hypothetical protein
MRLAQIERTGRRLCGNCEICGRDVWVNAGQPDRAHCSEICARFARGR